MISDDSDHALIPNTFELLRGLPHGLLAPPPGRSNRSLAWSEVELIRLLNRSSQDHAWSREDDVAYVKKAVVRPLRRAPLATQGSRTPPLPRWAVERVRAVGESRIEAIERLGVAVVGDPELLRLPETAADRDDAEAVPLLPLEVATRALAGVLETVTRERRGEG